MSDEKVVAFIKEHGTACGGNWTAMLMSAIHNGLPEVYKKMKDRQYSFQELIAILKENVK